MARSVSYTFHAKDQFTAVANRVKSSVTGIKERVKDLNRTLNDRRLIESTRRINDQVGSFAKKWSIASLAVGAFAGSAVVAAAKNEVMRKSFDVLTGSAEKGGKLLKDLYAFASSTPFEVTELGDAAKMLLSMGIETEKVISSLGMLGDMAAGADKPISELALVYGQIMSTTFLTGEDAMQLTNKNIGIRDMIAKKLNVDMATVYDLISSRMISAKFVENLLKEMVSEGGRYYNMMEERSKTLSGRWSNLADAVTEFKITLGAAIIQHLDLKKVVEDITKGVYWLSDAIGKFASEHPTVFKYVLLFVGILAILGPIVLAISAMVGAILAAASASGIFATAMAIGAAVAALWAGATALIYTQWETLGPYILGLWDLIYQKIQRVKSILKLVTWPTRKLLELTGIIDAKSTNQTDINVNIESPKGMPVEASSTSIGSPNINVGLNMAGAR